MAQFYFERISKYTLFQELHWYDEVENQIQSK